MKFFKRRSKALKTDEKNNPGVDRFIIISSPRTGSNLLCGLLDAHPEVICHYEIFHENEIYYSDQYGHDWIKDFTKEMRDKDPQKFLQFLYDHKFGKRVKTNGFKIFNGHNDPLLKSLLADPKVKKIILKRENLLMAFISKIEAEKSGVYFNIDQDKKPKEEAKQKINFDYRHFKVYEKNNLDFFASCRNQITASNQKHFELDYTEVLNNETLSELLKFLEVDSNTDHLEERFRKQNIKGLQERVENYEEMIAWLEKTERSHYLIDLNG